MWSPREFLNRPDPTPHVVDVVMLMELVNVYGGEKLGKSFLVMELLLCIATGMPFLGKYHVRRKGPVAYLTAEGSNGVKRRFLAWCGAHGVDPLTVPFYFKADVPRASKINEAQTYIDGILARLKSDGHTTLVAAAIDTLTNSLEGEDENSSAAVGAFWLMAKTILKALDITLMVVGHTGKDESKGQRGWSGSGGTIDRAILVDGGDPARKAKVLRMSHALAKDTDDLPTNYIRLAQQSVPGQPGVYSRVCIPITEKEYKDAIAKGRTGIAEDGFDPIEALDNGKAIPTSIAKDDARLVQVIGHALRQHEYTAPGNHATLTEVADILCGPEVKQDDDRRTLHADWIKILRAKSQRERYSKSSKGTSKHYPAGPLFKFIYRWTPNGDPEKVRPIHYWYAPPSDGPIMQQDPQALEERPWNTASVQSPARP